jgi:preprotein translocase subunit SecE
MARNTGSTSRRNARSQAAQPPATKAEAPEPPKKPFNPARFIEEVRAETRKVTWTSRQETWITSVMVFVMVLATAIFFVLVDTILGHGMQALLKFAS